MLVGGGVGGAVGVGGDGGVVDSGDGGGIGRVILHGYAVD